MTADKLRKPVSAMADLRAIENLGAGIEQTVPRSPLRSMLARGECADRTSAAEG
jgi:hypothetical protein